MTAPEPRRVLISTIRMTSASGTVTYTRDLALSLLRHGWLPIVYTSRLGPQAEILRRATIPVVTRLEQIGTAPDVIHGHHAFEMLATMGRFPNVPAVFVAHDALTWHSVPPLSPRIGAWVAVDRNCRDRLAFERGIAADRIRILTNPVDLQRFPKRDSLPATPRRALVFSNQAGRSTWTPIREACAQRGIEVDVVGETAGRAVDDPETLLPRYDVVFAKARCAIEAAAVGTAVIACDERGLAGMITTERLDSWRQLNFGMRTLQLPVTAENVLRELDRYDPVDAAAVSRRIRDSHDVDLLAEQFIDIYDELLATPPQVSPEENLASIAQSIEDVARRVYGELEPRHPAWYRLLRKWLR